MLQPSFPACKLRKFDLLRLEMLMLRIREYKTAKQRLAKFCVCIFLNLLFLAAPAIANAADTTAAKSSTRFDDILRYISKGWDTLTRSMSNCQTVTDPKAPEQS